MADDGGLGGKAVKTSSFGPTASAEGSTVGYWTADGTTGTFTCTSGSSFWAGLRVDGESRTYARCERNFGTIVTACDGKSARYTDIIESDTGGYECPGFCTTLKIFDYYNRGFGRGIQYMIDCEDFIGAPNDGSVGVFFREVPSDPTTSVAPSTTHDSPNSSAPLPIGDPGNNDGARGLSSGAIAGTVIGAIAGLCLIACGFYIAYRMGRKHRDDPEKPRRSFMDSLRAIPRPNVNITWTQPKGHTQPPVLQQTFAEDDITGPREMMGDTKQSSQHPVVTGYQGAQKPRTPAVELPAEHVVEVAGNGLVDMRTDTQQQPYVVDTTSGRPSAT